MFINRIVTTDARRRTLKHGGDVEATLEHQLFIRFEKCWAFLKTFLTSVLEELNYKNISASAPTIDLFVTILSDFQTIRVLSFLLNEDELLHLNESLKDEKLSCEKWVDAQFFGIKVFPEMSEMHFYYHQIKSDEILIII